MKKKNMLMTLLLAGLLLAVAGCTDSSSGPSGPVKATWVTPVVTADTVSIPQSAVEQHTNVHFYVPTHEIRLAFMAYELDGSTYVRANVCPPCNSIGFTLSDDILVCDTCGTMFEARTGNGISGGCVAYPKEEVPHTIEGGNIVMNMDDAMDAYGATLQRG